MRVPTLLTVVAAVSLTACGGDDDSPSTPNSPAPVLTSVTIGSAAQTVAVGQTLQLSASGRDQNGNAMQATIAWSSSPTGTATVNATSGLVTAVAAGTATITARATAGTVTVSATQQVVVASQSPVLTQVVISPPAPSIVVGATVQLSATATDQNGAAMAATVTWGTSDAGKANVGATTGLVTGVGAGTATISATTTAGGVTLIRTVTISITSFALNASVAATVSNTFVPATVEIGRTGTVTWTFQSLHNVVFTSGAGSPADIGDKGSGTAARDFNTVGTFAYICTLHAGMAGTVIVR
jgi:uncharacterized protein YjdB